MGTKAQTRATEAYIGLYSLNCERQKQIIYNLFMQSLMDTL